VLGELKTPGASVVIQICNLKLATFVLGNIQSKGTMKLSFSSTFFKRRRIILLRQSSFKTPILQRFVAVGSPVWSNVLRQIVLAYYGEFDGVSPYYPKATLRYLY